ncbi:MAG: NAD-dependent epimerase [Rhizobiaceae bacterium]
MRLLVTGVAGFIGFHVTKRLLDRGDEVVGIDNLNSYYDPALKRGRLAQLEGCNGFSFIQMDVADRPEMARLFAAQKPDRVVHLAAQAGVRYSLDHPHDYVDSNIVGFVNVLEGCRHAGVQHLVYASSSSVYGANERVPFSVADNVDHPISLYAASKKANELMAHSYSHLFAIPTTGLRFFTVYGPWGRPDMAYFKFTRDILAGQPIEIFNNGRHMRDFTYIDDIVEGVVRTLDHIATPSESWDAKVPNPASSAAPYRIYNIGNNQPVSLLDFVAAIEKAVGKPAEKIMRPLQSGDMETTYADIASLQQATGFRPVTSIAEGMARFVEWFRTFYDV